AGRVAGGRLTHQTTAPASRARANATRQDQWNGRRIRASSGGSRGGPGAAGGDRFMRRGPRRIQAGVQDFNRISPVNSADSAESCPDMASLGLSRKRWSQWLLLFAFWTVL